MTIQIGAIVECRGEHWSAMEYESSPNGFPPYIRLSRIDEHGKATALVVGQASCDVIGLPVFAQGDDVGFGLDSRGTVLADDAGEFVTVVSDFRRSYAGGSKFKYPREVRLTRAELTRDNIGLALNRV